MLKIKRASFIMVPVCVLVLFMTGCNLNRCIDESDIYFPVQKEFHEEHMDVLLKGTLIFDGKYLLIRSRFLIFGTDILPIWPYGYSLDAEDGKIQVLDEDGQVVARVGDSIKVGGGETTIELAESFIGESLPDDCEGPYWLVADVTSK